MVNFGNNPQHTDIIANLATMYNDIQSRNLLPARWVVNDFGPDITWSPVPEKDTNGLLTDHPAGAALWLCRTTSVPEPDELFYPDVTKYYSIIGKQSGKCIDVSNISLSNNAPVWIWDYISGANQQWKFIPTANSYFKIVSKNSGLCLSLINLSPDNGVNIVQQTDNNGQNQQWKIVNVNNGYFKIVSLYTGKCIDVQGYSTSNGGNIWQYDYLQGDNQKWSLNIVGDVP
jgi:hypothetical protein